MRQLAEGGHISPRRQTPDAGTPSSSLIVRKPGTDQITPVCLPLLSENNQLLWVYSNQIELPAASVAELNKAFDRFPYLTDKQSTELAQCCSLHPDMVKVWFMAQRVQYGISWDFKDIFDVRKKFRFKNKDAEKKREVPNEMDKEMQENQRKKKKWKDKDEESEEEKGGEEKSPKEGTTMVQKVSANENLERKSKQEQPVKKAEPRKAEDDTNTQNKRKQESTIENRGKKWVKQDNDDEGDTDVEIKTNNESQAFTESEGAVLNRKKRKAKKKQTKTVSKNPSEPDDPLSTGSLLKPPFQTLKTIPLTENQTDARHRAEAPSTVSLMTPANVSFDEKPEAVAGLQDDPCTEALYSDIMVTDLDKLKELTSIDNSLISSYDPPAPIKQDAGEPVAGSARHRNKTQTQLAMLKLAFLHCQYPDVEQYTWLAEQAEIPRHVLVQWYGDMRYALKRARPRWMTVKQYKQALGNIMYHQYLNKLKRTTGVRLQGFGEETEGV